jgi:hypothetical protein
MASDLWVYLAQKLAIRTQFRFPNLPFENGELVPTIPDLPAGEDEVGNLFTTGAMGEEAILLAPGASDIPLTPFSLGTDKVGVVMAAKGYSITWQQFRRMLRLGLQSTIENQQIDKVRFAIAQKLNRFSALGEPALGHTGLFNNSRVTPVNSSFNPNTATYAQWVSFFVDIVLSSGLSNDGETILAPTTLLMPQKMLVLAAQALNPINGNVSAIQAAADQLRLQFQREPLEIVATPYASSDILERFRIFPAGTNRDRLVVYTKDESVLSRRIENKVAQLVDERFLPSVTQNMTQVFPFFSCSSATMIHDPTGVRYINTTKVL